MKSKELVVLFTPKSLILDMQEVSGKAYSNDALLAAFKDEPYKALLHFGFEDKHPDMSASLSFILGFCQRFIAALSKDPDIEITRRAQIPETAEFLAFLHGVPYAVGIEYISIQWFAELWKELSSAFEKEISSWEGTVASYLNAHNAKLNVAGRVFFHLVENASEEYPFAFLATYSAETAEKGKAQHVPLKNALIEYKDRHDLLLMLLAAVSRAADGSDFISELVESGELFSPLQFRPDEAFTFLREIPFYQECGIMCRMPDWWRKKGGGLKVSISMGDKQPSKVGLEAIINCNPALTLDGVELSREEIETLLSQTAGLSYLKGKWIEVDHDKLKLALEAYEKASTMGGVTLAEAIRMELGIPGATARGIGDMVEITHGEWLKSIRNDLIDPVRTKNLELGDAFRAELRQYQQAGLNWLATMKHMGFGALLADDMGLGKTVQILALLEHLRQNGGVQCLLIIPASLIGNWQREIERFAPEIKYAVLHAQNTEMDAEVDLTITTYGMARRLDQVKTRKWDLLILDEAQAIKNPTAAQTKAVKQIEANFKIAMTGTPIENKLSDLWSLFDFLNTGILGTAKEFSDYAKRIKENDSYSKLRGAISPFILRRLKTDKAIISDLPDKVEINAYTTLTKKQVVLYQSLVGELQRRLESSEGIERKGAVLAAIMKFKQICNHPDQYLGQAEYRKNASGKFDKLQEICETIYEKRERVLVFTQFKEMTDPLADFLMEIFGRKGLVLHGGTAVKKRAELVERFGGDEYVPFMVLSLKAGGVGLNLTKANHVIHFDRWWNPAVENQATDRAFRIGQTKNVMVHKFITAGTIEEKIHEMIEEKQTLSGKLIGASGENWITEMSNTELMKLVALEV